MRRSCITAWKRPARPAFEGLDVEGLTGAGCLGDHVDGVFRCHDGVGKRDGRPMASATAMPCASMPSEPSVMIQVFSALALRLAAISASAPPPGAP